MSQDTSEVRPADGPPQEYQAAMADIEERAARGELTIAEVKRKIFALRERFAASPDRVMRWAAQAHAESSRPDEKPVQARSVESSDGQARGPLPAENLNPAPSSQPA